MTFRKKAVAALSVVAIVAAGGAAFLGYRTYRVYDIAQSWRTQIRYLVESGGSIGTAPASEALSDNYLEMVLGDNRELLDELKGLLHEGMDDTHSLNMGEVAAMNITYNVTPEGSNVNVAAHIAGGFPMESRKPGFHRDGFFNELTDNQLYSLGNRQVQFLGRDMIFFASTNYAEQHQGLMDTMFEGQILPLAESLTNRLYHVTVFPNPENVLPPQLRKHVQTVVTKGAIGQYDGNWDVIIITKSPESARYVVSIINDMKRTAEITLSSVLGGDAVETQWGKQYVWWARSMMDMSARSVVDQKANLVRVRTDFKREMVNATLKTVERAMRDYKAIRERFDENDPRVAKALAKADALESQGKRLESKGRRMLNYWSEDHQWGPDWPIQPKEGERPQPLPTPTVQPESAPDGLPQAEDSEAGV
ncbi:MAG: hypothetical protein PHG65_03615 [Kiritimatiellae bacterium]|nr:hypothetical protein [Kiritimatiellia bacterium]